LAALTQSSSKQISTEEPEKFLGEKDATYFLDGPEPGEVAHLGSVKVYVHFPVGQLESRLKEIPKNKLIGLSRISRETLIVTGG
jgi:hypothetical protein